MKRVFACTALLAVMFGLSIAMQGQQVYQGLAQLGAPAVGTEEPCILNPCTFYAGDFDINGQNPNALWNNNSTGFGISGTVYVPFTVPKKFKGAKGKTDWNVQGLFINELMDVGSATTASWSIVQGVAAGGNPSGSQVKTVCSGTGTPSLTATGRSGFGLTEYTIAVTGISCPILEGGSGKTSGTYWMTLVPTVPSLGYLSDVEDSTPTNAEGPGSEPVDDSFFYAPFFGFSTFTVTAPTVCGGIGCDSFSVGVIGTATH